MSGRRGPVPGFGGKQPGAGRPRAIPVGAEVALGLLIPLLPEPLRASPPPGWARRLLGTSRQRAAYLAAGRCALATLQAAIAARPVGAGPELAPAPERPPRDPRIGGRALRRECPPGLDLARPLPELRTETGAATATIRRWRREAGVAIPRGRPNVGRGKRVCEE